MAQQVVFLTGAAQGIGLTICEDLLKRGYIVYGLIRQSSNRDEVERLASNYQKTFNIVEGDVTDTQRIKELAKQVAAQESKIDIVINNACHVLLGTVESCTIEQQMNTMNVNYFGAVNTVKAFLPYMRQQNSGHIINISSVSGFEPWPHLETYVASKYALEGLSESMALHLSPWNIKISLIEPGGVKTKAPANAELGLDAITDTAQYDAYFKKAKQMMIESFDSSMPAQEVADVVYQAILKQDNTIRFQVGDYSKQAARQRFNDPSAKTYHDAKLKILEDMGLIPQLDQEEVDDEA